MITNPVHFPKKETLSTLKKELKTHYIIPGVNSIEAETLETIISEDITKEEVISFLKEEKYNKLLYLLENIFKKYNLDIKKVLYYYLSKKQ